MASLTSKPIDPQANQQFTSVSSRPNGFDVAALAQNVPTETYPPVTRVQLKDVAPTFNGDKPLTPMQTDILKTAERVKNIYDVMSSDVRVAGNGNFSAQNRIIDKANNRVNDEVNALRKKYNDKELKSEIGNLSGNISNEIASTNSLYYGYIENKDYNKFSQSDQKYLGSLFNAENKLRDTFGSLSILSSNRKLN
jgi:hypothetical protein